MVRQMILDTIKDRWNYKFAPYLTMGQFMKYVYAVTTMLNAHCVHQGDVVALYGRRSIRWIGVYIAVLLRKATLIIVPPGMGKNPVDVNHYLNLVETNIVFADEKLGLRININYSPLIKVVYDIETLTDIQVRESSGNEVTACIPLTEIENIIIEKEDLDKLFEDMFPGIPNVIVTPTSGVSYDQIKYVVINGINIESLLSKALDEIPYDMDHKVYSETEFASSHIISVLMPFLKGCIFVGYPEDADVFIEDTRTFEKVWRTEVDTLLENKLLHFIFNRRSTQTWFNKIALRRLKRYYNHGRKLQHIILYNNTVHERMMLVVRGNLPLWSTYGSQEMCQLIAYNDYSTKKLCRSNCVGKVLRGIDYKIDDSELYVSAATVFNHYFKDEPHTRFVKDNLWYKTGDVAKLDEELLFIKGRILDVHYASSGLPVYLDDLERIVRGDPHIKDAVLVSTNGELVLYYHPDDAFAESRNMDIDDLNDRMEFVFLEKMNYHLESLSQISHTKFRPSDFTRTHDDKVKKSYYRTRHL